MCVCVCACVCSCPVGLSPQICNYLIAGTPPVRGVPFWHVSILATIRGPSLKKCADTCACVSMCTVWCVRMQLVCAYVCVCERERVKTVAVRCSVLQCEDYLKGATGRGDVDLCVWIYVCVCVCVCHIQ